MGLFTAFWGMCSGAVITLFVVKIIQGFLKGQVMKIVAVIVMAILVLLLLLWQYWFGCLRHSQQKR